MAISNEEILDAIGNKTVIEVVDLISAMEEKFGVSAASTVAAGPTASATETAVVEEQTEFDVILTSFGASKIKVIKTVRTLTSLGLKDAKNLVMSAPATVKEGVSKEDAEDAQKQLEAVGASVEIK